MNSNQFLTVTQAAKLAGISRPTLYRWMKMDGFPVCRLDRVVRIPLDEFSAWLKSAGGIGGGAK